MKLVYDINQKPPLKKNLVYAFQQLLAIMAATLLVPVLADSTGLYLNQPAALFGAGMGTLFYIFIATRKKSPVFLGSSFAFCDINPSLVYQSSGLTGYVMAGSEQPLSITYWYLREILRTQSPQAVLRSLWCGRRAGRAVPAKDFGLIKRGGGAGGAFAGGTAFF